MNEKNTQPKNQNTNTTPESSGISKWILIGGAVVAALILARLLFSFGDGSAQPTPTPAAQPTIGVVAPFVGPVWEWSNSTDAAGNVMSVPNPAQYTIQFSATNTYQGKADCNAISGTYSVNGSKLQINSGATSFAACPPGSLSSQFTQQLFSVESFVMQGTDLILNLKSGMGKMQLHQSGAPNNAAVLIGPLWKWRQFQNKSNIQNISDPNLYTLQFSADGTIQIRADCNTGSGVYSAGNTSLSIQVQKMTRAACAPESLSDQFVNQLNAAVSYFAGGPDLVIQTQDGSQLIFGSGTFPTALPPTTIATATPLATLVPPTRTLTPPPACPGAPAIEFFNAQPPTIQKGQKTVLRWGKVTNATGVAIDQGVGAVAAPGSVIVMPAQTTTYILTATGCGGQAQAALTVQVIEPTVPPTQAPSPTTAPTQVPPTDKPTAQPTEKPTTPPGADLIGTWKWFGATMNDGTKLTPADPNQYTAQFQADGKILVKADCNTANGTYTTNGSSLTISLPVITQAICPEGSLSTQYVQLLSRSGSYMMQGANLMIMLQADSGTMTFSK